MGATYNREGNETYIGLSKVAYSTAKAESTSVTTNTYHHSIKVRSAPTSRTDGEVRLRIAPGEMPEPKNINTTK